MKKHVKNYFEFFKIGEQDIIFSELSGRPANDLHHLIYRGQGGSDDIENIMALTRDEHDPAHFKLKPFLKYKELKKKHDEVVKRRLERTKLTHYGV